MKIKVLFAAAVCWASASATAYAEPQAFEEWRKGACESGAVDEEALAAARRVVVSARLQQTLLNAMDIMIPSMLGPLAEAYHLTPEQTALVQRVVTEEMRANPGELIDLIAQTYARRLSAADLNAVADFHESEAGQRLLDATPALQTEFAVVGQAWGQTLAPRVRARIEELSRNNFEPPT